MNVSSLVARNECDSKFAARWYRAPNGRATGNFLKNGLEKDRPQEKPEKNQ
jgi:hypothetical protein